LQAGEKTTPRFVVLSLHRYRLRNLLENKFMAKNKYKDLVAQAEQAVSSVSDPSLKQIAFQKVLDDLLNSTQETEEAVAPTARSKPPVPKKSENLRGAARGGPTRHIQELIGDGFFKKPKTISQVKAELGNRGHHIAITGLSMPLMRLCKARVLRRNKSENNTYLYSPW
jgi:hypothetical protein